MGRTPAVGVILFAGMLAACDTQTTVPNPPSTNESKALVATPDGSNSEVAAATAQGAQPVDQLTATKETNMIIKQPAKDRLPPPDVPPVERDGVRYEQAADGRDVGAEQVAGVLVAIDVKSGTRLWSLTVYPNVIDPALEADVQWKFFTSMAFDSDGHLRIVNEEGKAFLVDVKARTVTGQ